MEVAEGVRAPTQRMVVEGTGYSLAPSGTACPPELSNSTDFCYKKVFINPRREQTT